MKLSDKIVFGLGAALTAIISIAGFVIALPLIMMGAAAVVSLFDGIDVPFSSYVGQSIQVYPKARITKYNSGGTWKNQASYLLIDMTGGYGISKSDQPVTFKVSRVQFSHEGVTVKLRMYCTFVDIENPNQSFIEHCEDIPQINQTTALIQDIKKEIDKNGKAVIKIPNYRYKTNAKKIKETDKTALYEISNLEDFFIMMNQVFKTFYADVWKLHPNIDLKPNNQSVNN